MKTFKNKLNKDFLIRFVKKQWKFILSIILLIIIGVIYFEAIKFISLSFKKVFNIDERRVQSGVTQIDLEKYERTKHQWKDFQDGKYKLPINVPVVNITPREIKESSLNNDIVNEQKETLAVDDSDIIIEKPIKEKEESIIVKNTSTGWLNVRKGPGVNFQKIRQIYPEESYVVLQEDNGWYQIKIDESMNGWVISSYVILK